MGATEQRHEPPAFDTSNHRAPMEPGRGELGGRHDAVLAGRQDGRGTVAAVHFVDFEHPWRVTCTFGTHTVRFVHVAR